ncbi:MAG: SDR family oxidoreductase [Dehalococcoidales bacterium]|nr:SDR family oxidoreductase [Dehalococcoidales bacterium]
MPLERKFTPIQDLISLANKKALVTGGASGIGYAISYRLAEAGAAVTIADINEEKGRKAAQDLSSCGYRAIFQNCDAGQEESVIQAVDKAVSGMGGLDILVNNAGIFPPTPIQELNSEMIEKVLSVNLKGLLYFTREASRRMIEQKGGGCIINLASIDSLHPSHKDMSVYDASKGAVLTLTRSLAKELAPDGIRVNAIAPGGILTEGAVAQRPGQNSRAGLKEFQSRIPLGKMGIADDIGRVALFLASDLSGYMTGSVVVVDGGYLIS